ncbi:MAG: T9SS type A sorting domain-containing protein, partial [Bacteroidota bacterium]
FGSIAGLSISGKLIAQRTSGDHVTISCLPETDYWFVITLQPLSNATLSFCDVLHAQVGINGNGVLPSVSDCLFDSCKIGLSLFQSGGQISTSTFTHSIIKGVSIDGEYGYVEPPSAPVLTDNAVSSNTAGIYVTTAAPVLERNSIAENSAGGVWCSSGGNPFTSRNELDAPGQNIFTGNGVANLLAENCSFPFVGFKENDGLSTYGGHNSFGPAFHAYDVLAKSESGVMARQNFWSEDPPNEETSFRTDDPNSWIDWTFPLKEYGNRPMQVKGAAASGAIALSQNESPDMGTGLLDGVLNAAMSHRSGKRFGRSMTLVKQYIARTPTPLLAPVALVMLQQIAMDSAKAARNSSILTTFAAYSDSLLNATTSDRLKRTLLNARKNHLLQARHWTDAIAVAETISVRYPNTILDEHACYSTVTAYLLGFQDLQRAQQALHTMRQRFPNSHRTAMADVLISSTAIPSGGSGSGAAKLDGRDGEQSVQMPTQSVLHQNYPNPFNPSTTIKYDLPVSEHVTFKLYDVLGREVSTLVDELVPAGYHQASFDGSKFSTGVYFYRMQAGSFTGVKRLMLLK